MLRYIVRKYLEITGQLTKQTENIDKSIKELEHLTVELNRKESIINEHYKILELENQILLKAAQNVDFQEIIVDIVESMESLEPESTASVLIYYDGKLWDLWSPHIPTDYAEALSNGFPLGSDHGTCGTAAYNKEPVYTPDISTHPNWCKFPDVQKPALEAGFKSCISIPILGTNNQLLGTIASYYPYTQEECHKHHYWSARIAAVVIERYYEQRQLHQQEERLRGILESQTDLVQRATLDGILTYANKAYLETFGITEEQIENREINYYDLVHPEDKEATKDEQKALYTPPNRVYVIQRALTVKGYRWFEWEGAILFDEQGNPVEHQASGRDITERKAEQEALHQRNQELQGILDSSLDLIIQTDLNYNLIYANKAYCDVFNIEDLTQVHPIELVYEEDRDFVRREVKKLPSRLYFEARSWIGNELRWFEWQIYPLRDKLGNIYAYQGSGRDITERKEVSYKFNKMIDDVLDIAVQGFDDRGIIKYWNRASEKFYGYTKDEVIGKNIKDILCEEVEIMDFMVHYKMPGGPREVTQIRKDGRTIDVYTSNAVVKTLDGSFEFFNLDIDISEKKHTERILDSYYEELKNKNELLEVITESSGGYIWYKDWDHYYKFCDNSFKDNFFKLPRGYEVVGKNDIDLIQESGNRKDNDLGRLSQSTDDHAKSKGYQCRYIEGGYIQGELFILEVNKTPVFDEDGEYIGNVGVAWNKSTEYDTVTRDIEFHRMDGLLEVLSDYEYYEGTPFVYYLNSKEPKRKVVLSKNKKLLFYNGEQEDGYHKIGNDGTRTGSTSVRSGI